MNDSHDSTVFLKQLIERVQAPGQMVKQHGEENTDWPKDSTMTATYTVPYLAHSPMEPPVAIASVTDKGCELWASSQTPQRAAQNVAGSLGIKEDRVKVNVTLLGEDLDVNLSLITALRRPYYHKNEGAHKGVLESGR